ncbi:unnamed protein product [Blepharisma stoltei]|uniref:EGF-like domain-containing protein n=1 Tax=Blepharisma stoltei TaxID=1481888 RepID=A0AAU9JA41_9CILI|nr:unnamed protein product [Blepharisma stoltei]
MSKYFFSVTINMYFLALLLSAASGATCPLWSCSTSLATGVCVEYQDSSTYLVNYNGCPSSAPYCNYESVLSWIPNAFSGYTWSCETTNTTDYWTVPSSSNYLACKPKYYNKNLASGSHPKECSTIGSTDSNCILKDGSYSECKCGLNGKAYCVPEPSSEAFSDYWTQCCTINCGHMDTFKHYLYWYLKMEYYVEYISGYSCTKIFTQFSDIDNLDYVGDGAIGLLMGLGAVILL